MAIPPLSLHYSITDPSIDGYSAGQRWLSQLDGSFADQSAYKERLEKGDVFVYQVTNIENAAGEGQLHYGLAVLMPGKVGKEYFLTRGHIHAWRPAAEVYICLSGKGMMLLENVETGVSSAVPLTPQDVVYVPGNTIHRTVNVGDVPLVYWGILSSEAGHDYEIVKQKNFSQVIIEHQGQPLVIRREDFHIY